MMMNYHARIVNIPSDTSKISDLQARNGYIRGHCAARHSAAEIALEAQLEIDQLKSELEKLKVQKKQSDQKSELYYIFFTCDKDTADFVTDKMTKQNMSCTEVVTQALSLLKSHEDSLDYLTSGRRPKLLVIDDPYDQEIISAEKMEELWNTYGCMPRRPE